MLEAITDFWKPVKKTPSPVKLKLTDMQIGSVVGFGYVPQTMLSGRKLTVTSINSYKFGNDVLTSFVLSGEKDSAISMIIAEAQGEQYLAISRRVPISDRIRLFDDNAIEDIINNKENARFVCKDNVPELRGWLVNNYKREIQGMRGHIYKADFRKERNDNVEGEEFQYTLLGSSSNEHAIEIEKYDDGRVDVYATVYRRISDITDVVHASSGTKQPEDMRIIEKSIESNKEIVPAFSSKNEEKEQPVDDKKDENMNELVASDEIEVKSVIPEIKEPESLSQREEIIEISEKEKEEENNNNDKLTKNYNEEKETMSVTNINMGENKPSLINGVGSETQNSSGFSASVNKNSEQGAKKVSNLSNGMDNESIECDLRVANQVIEEAIRNEMRLSDVVRRIIELPVAHQEAVQLPITLADEDYSLLAIRYGIPSSDRNAIKLRIIQDLADFSGNKKKTA